MVDYVTNLLIITLEDIELYGFGTVSFFVLVALLIYMVRNITKAVNELTKATNLLSQTTESSLSNLTRAFDNHDSNQNKLQNDVSRIKSDVGTIKILLIGGEGNRGKQEGGDNL